MKRGLVFFAVCLTILTGSLPAFPLLMERAVRAEDLGHYFGWVPGLDELARCGQLVYGVDTDAPTFSRGYRHVFLFFRGDNEGFNEMLEQYAKLEDSLKRYVDPKDTPLTLILHPGRGNTAWAGRSLAKGRNFTFDWLISIMKHGTLLPEEKQRYTVTVQVWVGGEVELGKVKVPFNVKVSSGGEIERFIAAHEEKRGQNRAP